jgi:hypothetical protein
MRPTTAARWRLPWLAHPKMRAPPLVLSEQVEIMHSVEEEIMPGYSNLNFLPVNVGQIINDRYDVIAKLGYGSASTVCLPKDI